MKIGLLSDAHGNHLGLQACLQFLHRRAVDEIVFLGDAVGYLSKGNQVLELLKQSGAQCLLGNHDAMMIEQLPLDPKNDEVYKIAAMRQKLLPSHKKFLNVCVPFLEKQIGDKRLLFVHGNPWNPIAGYTYPDSCLDGFSDLPYDAIFMGHTHIPFVKEKAGKLVVNVGSCGLPRDQGDLAACGIYNSDSGCVEIFRVPLDVNKIIQLEGEQLHAQVIECLKRKSLTKVIGCVIEK